MPEDPNEMLRDHPCCAAVSPLARRTRATHPLIPSLRTQGKYGALSINEPVDTEPVRQRRRPGVCVVRRARRARAARPRDARAARGRVAPFAATGWAAAAAACVTVFSIVAYSASRGAPPPREAAVYATSARLFETRLEPWAGVGLKEVIRT